MLSLVSVALWTSVFLLRQNFANAIECNEMSIKFNMNELLQLTNCTSILGSLTIASLDYTGYVTEINMYQFPELKEITGYLILLSIKGLSSPAQLFPNLAVIRGKQLVMSFALVIFDNPNMTTVNLTSLISIQRGYVLIEQCPALCFQDTIDWEAITEEDEDYLNAGNGNVIQKVLPTCPTYLSCRGCDNYNCWSAYDCQRSKTNFRNFKQGICHESCLGGCVNKTASDCHVCTKLAVNGKCVDECPSDLFIFRDIMRCITKQKCTKFYKMIAFNGECRRQCPVSFSHFHPVTKEYHRDECFKCEIKCMHRCEGATIRGPTDLESFRECTIVDGSLYISLGLNMTDIYAKLDETLGNIETINGALTIYRSFSLTSLSFFRNLNKINAQNATSLSKGDEEYRNPYALEIYENDNLQVLFNWKEKQYFEIVGGGIFFHNNAKLCLNELQSLQNITNYDRAHDSIGHNTNGYDETCHATGIFAFNVVTSPSDVQIYWNISDFGPDRRLIGYFVYYIEAPSQNISYFSGLDACSTRINNLGDILAMEFQFKPPTDIIECATLTSCGKVRQTSKITELPMISKKNHGEVWQSVFVPLQDLKRVEGSYQMNVTGLKQYTQYAYYVRTQLSLKLKDQLINVTQGQSPVKYFTTFADQPRPPIVRTKDRTNVSITLEWIPSTPENELVQRYFVDVYALIDDVNEFDKRDYCLNPKVNVEEKTVVKAHEKICCRDQRAYLEFFRRDSNQTCGEWDSNCEKTFKFVLFHHHVESALLKAGLERDPSENRSIIHHKREYYEAPVHHQKGKIDPIIRKNESDASRYYLHSHIIDDQYMDSLVIPNLKPFHLYAFYVYACNNASNCSDYYFHSDRTAPSIRADDIAVVPIPDKHRTDVITLTTKPPTEPNAVTVAYEIESYDYLRKIARVKCITRKEMEFMNYTIRFENVLHGTHSYRIRSLSIGGDGMFSDWIFLEVEQSDHIYVWGSVLAFVAISIIILGTVLCEKIKAYRNPRARDIEYLLPERRDSDADGEPKIKRPESKKRQLLPSHTDRDKHWSLHAESSEGIPMKVFSSHMSDAMLSLEQPLMSNVPRAIYSTSNISAQLTGSHSQPNHSQRMMKSMQVSPKKDDSSQNTELDSDDYDYSLFQ